MPTLYAATSILLVAAALDVLAGVAHLPARMQAGPGCEAVVVGLGPAHSNDTRAAFFGRSLAQVFTSPDTLIRSITVWRQPDQFENLVPMHLFIGAMSAIDSLRPDPLATLLDGPIMALTGPSESSRAVRFEFDPPWALPEPGRYYFAIKEDACIALFVLLTDSTGAYADGDLWEITPAPGCVGLGNNSRHQGGTDLIFEIEFCALGVGAEPRSWGGLKSTYR